MAVQRVGPAKITMRDVAERVGLSVSAVSQALLDGPRIGEDAKARVRDAAEELGYVTNSAARALRARRADAIALIVPNTSRHVFGHTYFMHVLTGVADVANSHDAQLVISTDANEHHGKVAYDRVMRSGSVDGAIVTSAAVDDKGIDQLVSSGMPVVLLGGFPDLPDAVSVGIDDVAASFTATEHLVREHGRRNLVHISGPLNHQAAIDRRDGFLAAAHQYGAHAVVVEGQFDEESGARAATSIQQTNDMDGIVAANDEMAFGAIRRLTADVPSRVSVVGFDDFGLARVTTPAITTLRVPAEDMARGATDRLFDLIAGARFIGPDAHAVLPTELVVRQSCGCHQA